MLATSDARDGDTYRVLRHLFTEAMESSTGDKRWHFYGSNTDPEREVATEYEHATTGDRIKCESSRYLAGEYQRHVFTYQQGPTP